MSDDDAREPMPVDLLAEQVIDDGSDFNDYEEVLGYTGGTFNGALGILEMTFEPTEDSPFSTSTAEFVEREALLAFLTDELKVGPFAVQQIIRRFFRETPPGGAA